MMLLTSVLIVSIPSFSIRIRKLVAVVGRGRGIYNYGSQDSTNVQNIFLTGWGLSATEVLSRVRNILHSHRRHPRILCA